PHRSCSANGRTSGHRARMNRPRLAFLHYRKLHLDQPLAQAFVDRLGTARGIELAQQRLDMKLDGVLRDAELARDGLVAEPVADRGEDLDLARRQQAQLLLGDRTEGR